MRSGGLVQIYTGAGKGKTTAAIGAGIRAVGQGLSVHMIQFLKGGKNFPPYGEILAIRDIPHFTVEQFGPDHFIRANRISDEDRKIVRQGLNRAREALTAGYDIVILDEINVLVQLGLATVDEVLELLRKRPSGTEVIITGRGAPEELISYADLVSRIDAVKHPYDRGIQARVGIEY